MLARLIYLACQHSPSIPSWRLLKHIPGGALLPALSQFGLAGLTHDAGVSDVQAKALYETGAISGEGSAQEFKLLVAHAVRESIKLNEEIKTTEWLDLLEELHAYMQETAAVLQDFVLDITAWQPEYVKKVSTSISPIDRLLDGGAVGLVGLLAASGVGKTALTAAMSARIAMLEEYTVRVIENEDTPALYCSRYREVLPYIKPKTLTVNFGVGNVKALIKDAQADPVYAQNTVIVYDSPDVNVNAASDNHVGLYGAIFTQLAALAQYHPCVIYTSQVKRGERESITIESGAGSSAKERYSGQLLGFVLKYAMEPGSPLVMLSGETLKNRFGRKGQKEDFMFNYQTLEVG